MRAIVDIDLVMKLIRFKAHITVYYTYLYLYIYYICTIYIIYNTTYKIHCNIAYFTLPKKINFIPIIYIISFQIFRKFWVETVSKLCSCNILYPTESHLLTDKNIIFNQITMEKEHV